MSLKPLQVIQNAAACFVFAQPNRALVTPLLVSLHWLHFTLAFRTPTGSAPSYYSDLTLSRPLLIQRVLVVSTDNNAMKSKSRLL